MKELEGRWLDKAELLEAYAPSAAEAFRSCADDLGRARKEHGNQVLTIQEAARLGGYSQGHLRRMVRDGNVPNAGRKGAPRIRRDDVPIKGGGTSDPTLRQDPDVIDLAAHRNEQVVRSVANK